VKSQETLVLLGCEWRFQEDNRKQVAQFEDS